MRGRSGSGSAYTCSTSPSFTPAAGDRIQFKADVASTGSATLAVNGASAATFKKWGATSNIVAGDLQAGHWVSVIYDGTYWQLEGQLGTTNIQSGTVLPSGVTATTQAVADTSTDVATDAYVTGFVKSSMTKQITSADVSCGTGGTISSCTSAQTITGLTFTLPSVSATWSFECNLVVGEATAATANEWLIQTATNGATNLTAFVDMHTASGTVITLATTDQASTTTAVEIGGATWTLGATGTKMPAHIYGTVEGASASGTTLNFMVLDPTIGDLLTIYRGSWCRVW